VLATLLHTELLSRRVKKRERENEEKLANGERERAQNSEKNRKRTREGCEREIDGGQGADSELSKPPGEDKHHNCSKLER
jgi:hypothetical protein